MKEIIRSLLNFFWAGVFEIGGGYLIWQSLREGKPWWWGLLGGLTLALYGVVATFQTADFGRVYAAYGGIFIGMAMIWGWKMDGIAPDRYDWIGAAIAFLGALIMLYAPRS
ncbi:YnfA family protein [Pseudanabaenaceae cyanobacterium LEGE 13415]|nr:YnfA family protein [Pseudanabaenaceae cyanobacterium LEGE 13415]